MQCFKSAGPEFRREVQPPTSLNGLDVPSRRAVFVPWKPSRRRGSEWETRLSVEEPMLSTGLHFASESTQAAQEIARLDYASAPGRGDGTPHRIPLFSIVAGARHAARGERYTKRTAPIRS